MPPIDYTIPGQFRGVQVESPMNAMAQAMQMRNLQESSQMNALKTQEYQRARQEENAVRNWFASGKKLDSPEALNELYQVAPGSAPAIEKSFLERGKAAAEIGYKTAQGRKETAEALDKELGMFKYNASSVTSPEAAEAHTAAIYDHPELGKFASKIVPREQAMAQSRDLFMKDPQRWLLSQTQVSGDKIIEVTAAREKQKSAEDAQAYSDYVRTTVLRDPDAKILSKADFLAQRNQAAAPMAAPAEGPTAAPTTAPTGPVTIAPDGSRVMPGVTVEDSNLIEPAVAALLATGDPRDKELAQLIEKRLVEARKRQELTGDFQNIVVARKQIEQLKKDPTPVNLAIIKDLEEQIKAANQGKAPKISNVLKLPEAVKAIDTKYADDYLAWRQGGGSDAAGNAAQIKSVLDRLASGEALTGKSIGLAPDFFNALVNPAALGAKQQVEEVVQRNLRAVLGAQFTQVEGERLIARAFDARLSPQENAKRLRKLFMQIESAAQQKEAMAQYYEANETLRGYKGKQPSIQDFYNVLNAPDAPPKGSVDVKGPDGKTYRFPDKKSADEFKKSAGIKE
jgi:hypothetical protein